MDASAQPPHSEIGEHTADPSAKPIAGTEDHGGAGMRSPFIRVLKLFSAVLPGEYLKTAFYLNCIDAPRRALREALLAFYRYDHVYGVLREFRANFPGRGSILEFGTSDGYSFAKLLYATRHLRLEERIAVHTFDSFEGMPDPADDRDRDWATGDDWVRGQFRGRYEALIAWCETKRYRNAHVHRGYFEQSIDQAFLDALEEWPPILVWIDCDYYSSTRTVFERLLERLPNGCVLYFDEFDNLNYGSRLTGEARIVHEINTGGFGENIELVADTRLGLNSRRVYRFLRVPATRMLRPLVLESAEYFVHRRGDGSPLP
jgi:Methyltransferase domain